MTMGVTVDNAFSKEPSQRNLLNMGTMTTMTLMTIDCRPFLSEVRRSLLGEER
jgi:hypothetical protein